MHNKSELHKLSKGIYFILDSVQMSKFDVTFPRNSY